MDAAKALRANPGQWALVKVGSTAQAARNAAHQIRHGRIVAYQPAGQFDATSRTVSGEHRVYVRYVGAQGGDEQPTEEYPGELAHLRELLRKLCRLENETPDGSPLRELLIDHYSDSQMVDADLRRREQGGA